MSSCASELDFGALPAFTPRKFVPAVIDLENTDEVIPLYRKLLDRPINSSPELEQWLLDRSELESALDQTATALYIRMTCQTDDPKRAQSYQKFIETLVPAVKPLADALNQKYLKERAKFVLDPKRYDVHDRDIRTDVELFVPENIPLQTQESLLSQEYQTISGAMTVHFQGEEKTLPQMGKYLLETDRALREAAWRATTERRLKDKEKLDQLFDKMLAVRTQIAANAGFSNFMEYQFRALHRFDYTPADCKQYHATVEKLIVPLCRNLLELRRKYMGVAQLRPWDTEVDPQGREALRPFETIEELIPATEKIFNRLDPELGSQFSEMANLGLLDLASRKGKAPGGYQNTLSEARQPFIFMNAVGVHQDVMTLLHEGGHAFHAMACRQDPILTYRHGPMEFCEVASMGMELLAQEHLDIFYDEKKLAQARFSIFEDIIMILAWVATIDSFQHWLYENPKHSAAERTQAWLEVRRRFGGGVIDWTGLEEAQAYLWHRQLHIFEVPFYYIEYGIAQLGALQLWMNAKKDKGQALSAYRRGLALGGSRPLPELFAAAGIKFDFSEKTIAPLVKAVQAEMEKF